MSCAQVRAILGDVALGSRAAPEVASHLDSCATCRGALAEEQRLADRMTRELEEGLGAEPSVGFVARVRQRIAAEPEVARSLAPSWLLQAAAGTFALALLVLRTETTVPEPPRGPGAVVPAVPASPPRGIGATQASGASRALVTERKAAPAPRAATVHATEPEILIPPRDRAAFERYVQMEPGPAPADALVALAIADLVIAPLEIGPLASVETSEGG